MKPEQLHILQHSLGADRYSRGTLYRNKFVTGPGGDDFAECRALTAAGLMKDYGPQEMMGGMHYFKVTELGITAMREASPKPPRLTRAQQRYRDFLDEDSSMDFGEWLKVRRA